MDATPEPMIRFERVRKEYADGTVAVQKLSLDVRPGELVVLVGPSGCGKTTTMKMVNRLVDPSGGRVLVEGRDVATQDPVELRRRIGYVIQHVGLFPHRTVADNVATVPSLLGWDRRRTQARVGELLELVGLDATAHGRRYPHELSGGQRQRVGVARALAADPPVLLMDEPFGAVDPIARDRLQSEFQRLHRELGTTVLFVTHDIGEAVRLGDRIAVLRSGGVLEQYDAPAAILGRPATPFVAEFVGTERALRRLAVTPIPLGELARPPVVATDTPVAAARRALGSSPWGVVFDRAGDVVGQVEAGDLDEHGPAGGSSGPGGSGRSGHGVGGSSSGSGDTAGDRVRHPGASVPADASLETALALLLENPDGWVAVTSVDGYAGVLTLEAVHAAALLGPEVGAGRAEPARPDEETQETQERQETQETQETQGTEGTEDPGEISVSGGTGAGRTGPSR